MPGSEWLSELKRLWPNVPWQVACELVYGYVPTLCVDNGIASPLRLRWVKGTCLFWWNLPPALLAVWSGSFTCHCGNMGVDQTPNKTQHPKLTLEKKILQPLLPGFELQPFDHESGALTNKLSRLRNITRPSLSEVPAHDAQPHYSTFPSILYTLYHLSKRNPARSFDVGYLGYVIYVQ